MVDIEYGAAKGADRVTDEYIPLGPVTFTGTIEGKLVDAEERSLPTKKNMEKIASRKFEDYLAKKYPDVDSIKNARIKINLDEKRIIEKGKGRVFREKTIKSRSSASWRLKKIDYLVRGYGPYEQHEVDYEITGDMYILKDKYLLMIGSHIL